MSALKRITVSLLLFCSFACTVPVDLMAQETPSAAPDIAGIWKRYNMKSGGDPATWEFRINNGNVETRLLDAGFGETYVTDNWQSLSYNPSTQTLTDPYDPADPNKFLKIVSRDLMRERVIWQGRYLEFEWRRQE